MGTLHEDQYTLLIISHSVLLRKRNVSDKTGRGNQNTHLCSVTFFFSKIVFFYEIMWKNIIEPRRPQVTIWLTHIACWISKATRMFIICSTYCFSITPMVARMRLNVMFI
jgi:hypothetical protein